MKRLLICSTQLRMKFNYSLKSKIVKRGLLDVIFVMQMPTIVEIWAFISMIYFMLGMVEHEKS